MENVKIGDIIELIVDDFGSEGEGIAHCDGSTIFVGGGIKGEKIKARVTHFNKRKNLIFTKTSQILKASPTRVVPTCPVHSACGGCTMQHISYAEQLNIKCAQIKNCLAKYSKIQLSEVEIVPSNKQFGYRNKLQLPVREERGEIKIGFFRENTHFVVPINKCPLHEDWADKLISAVKEYMTEKGVTAYNETTNIGLIRHIVARKFSENISIILVVNGKNLPYAASLVKKLRGFFGTKFSLALSENTLSTNIIINSDKLITLSGAEEITENYNKLKVSFSPLAFLQVNNYIAEKIYDQVIALVDQKNTVIDAYSGIGIMTAMIAKHAKAAYGIEIVEPAVKVADKLKLDNKIPNMHNILGDVALELPKLITELSASGVTANDITVVLDPPRKGCEPKVMSILKAFNPAQIIYVSCNPATLARDIATLNEVFEKNTINTDSNLISIETDVIEPPSETARQSSESSEKDIELTEKNILSSTSTKTQNSPHAYEVSYIKGFDMFPNSGHVECVCLLTKNK